MRHDASVSSEAGERRVRRAATRSSRDQSSPETGWRRRRQGPPWTVALPRSRRLWGASQLFRQITSAGRRSRPLGPVGINLPVDRIYANDIAAGVFQTTGGACGCRRAHRGFFLTGPRPWTPQLGGLLPSQEAQRKGRIGAWLQTSAVFPRVSAIPPPFPSGYYGLRPLLEANYGNIALSCGGGNHAGTCGLRGGAEGIRTTDLRSGGARGGVPPLPRLNIAQGAPLDPVLDRCCFPCPTRGQYGVIAESVPKRTLRAQAMDSE